MDMKKISPTFHILTLFPDVIDSYIKESILGRAQKKKKLLVKTYQLRKFVKNKWGKIDEKPYGGGPGMVLQAEPVVRAVEQIGLRKPRIIVTSAGGKLFTNVYAKKLSTYRDVVIICGRYEGIDARAKKILRAEEISIGPYILTGGEIAALAILDATSRHIPGVLGKSESIEENRISSHDVYTRPEVITHKEKEYRVPKVLLSGHHERIDTWKLKRSFLHKRDRKCA